MYVELILSVLAVLALIKGVLILGFPVRAREILADWSEWTNGTLYIAGGIEVAVGVVLLLVALTNS